MAGLYLILPNTTINGPKYVKLLKEKLKLHMHVPSCTIFMQDGTPLHQSKSVTDFLKNKISVLEWAGNSPDINPIENLWIRWHTSNYQALKNRGKQSKKFETLKSSRSIANLWYQACCIASKRLLTAKDTNAFRYFQVSYCIVFCF